MYSSVVFLWPFVYIIKYFFPDSKNDSDKNDLIYFDFETTGLNPYHDKIIEYSFIQEENEEYENEAQYENNTYISSLVNPRVKFDKKITDITGIYPDDLKTKSSINKHILHIDRFINYSFYDKDIYLVAHNCDSFDKLFLIENIKTYNRIYEKQIQHKHLKYIDTLSLCKKLIPRSKSYSMKAMCDYFNIEPGTHRSMSDTIALRKLYHKLIEKMSVQLNLNKDFILFNPEIVYNYIY